MKFEYNENKYGMDITMIPENPKEMAELIRISRNAISEKPDIRFYFNSESPSCLIWIKKRKEGAQVNSISPETKQ